MLELPEQPRRVRKEDYAEINSWLAQRNIPTIPLGLFPPTGFIAPGIAAAFLIKTDSQVGVIDYLSSNPKLNQMFTNNHIDAIIRELVSECNKENYKMVVGNTFLMQVVKRAKVLDFTQHPNQMVSFSKILCSKEELNKPCSSEELPQKT